jgi:hypothetical protein
VIDLVMERATARAVELRPLGADTGGKTT